MNRGKQARLSRDSRNHHRVSKVFLVGRLQGLGGGGELLSESRKASATITRFEESPSCKLFYDFVLWGREGEGSGRTTGLGGKRGDGGRNF